MASIGLTLPAENAGDERVNQPIKSRVHVPIHARMKEMVRQSDATAAVAAMPRLSVRYRVAGIGIDWIAPQGGRVLPNRKKMVEAKLLDLSVAGALVRAPKSSAIKTGSQIDICLSGEAGIVQVRNMRTGDDGLVLYGVVFHRISPALEAAIYDGIARLRNDKQHLGELKR